MPSEQRHKYFDANRGSNRSGNLKSKTMSTKPNSPGQRKLLTSMERLQMRQPNINRRAAGSNWQSAKAPGSENQNHVPPSGDGVAASNDAEVDLQLSKAARTRLKRKALRDRYVAMDCEMVGIGHNGQDDMLARVSITNKVGTVLIDKFVKPRHPVTDYRTSVSGIRPQDIENAEEFKDVREEVVKLLQGKILVGHGLNSDLAVLNIKHPMAHTRDTSRYKPLCKLVSNGRTPSLKRLAMAILGMEIQTGEHNSVEDARAAMEIYNRVASDWEKYIEKRLQHK